MIIIVLTIIFIFIYLLYPQWLKMQAKAKYGNDNFQDIDNVSIIYLSQNGQESLEKKVSFLLDEMRSFEKSELIVIDDASTDRSTEILKCFGSEKLRLITKESKKSIPHSMNLGVQLSNFQNIVFCDQRQKLKKGVINKLVEPLKHEEVGAVSSCISSYDKLHNYSILRAHENATKIIEGRTGNLMGVYGPLYALKKDCYKEIPESTILDDLYLTLSVLRNKQVVFQNECKIYDDSLDLLYNYKRTKRYLAGFFQILEDKELLSQLSSHQKLMLFWHKYFRIPIPLLITCCYVLLGIKSFEHSSYSMAFWGVTILSVFLVFPINYRLFMQIRSMIRFISFYTMAIIELLIRLLVLNQNIYEK